MPSLKLPALLLLAALPAYAQSELQASRLLLRNQSPPGTGADLRIQNAARQTLINTGILTTGMVDSGFVNLADTDGNSITLNGLPSLFSIAGVTSAPAVRFALGWEPVGDTAALSLTSGSAGLVDLNTILNEQMVRVRNASFANRIGLGVSAGDDGTGLFTADTGESIYINPATGLRIGDTTIIDGASSALSLTLPPAAPLLGNECIEMTTAGALVLSGAVCGGGGGGSSSGTNNEVQITDNAGGFTTVANFTATGTAINVPVSITLQTDSNLDLAASGTRFDEGFFDNLHTEDLLFRRQGAGSHDFVLANEAINVLRLRDAAATLLMSVDTSGTAFMSLSMNLFAQDTIPDGDSLYDLGTSARYWAQAYIDDIFLDNDIVPDLNNVSILGGPANEFAHVYTDDITITGTCTGCPAGGSSVGPNNAIQTSDGSGGFQGTADLTWTTTGSNIMDVNGEVAADLVDALDGEIDDLVINSTLNPDFSGGADIGTSLLPFDDIYGGDFFAGRNAAVTGDMTFYHGVTSGSVTIAADNTSGSVGMQISDPFYPQSDGVHDLGLSTREWDDIYGERIRASSAFYGPSGVAGSSSTFICLAGEAVKSITASGGIITGVACGTP